MRMLCAAALAVAMMMLAPATALGKARPSVQLPPHHYDRAYTGKLRIYIRTFTEVNRMCREAGSPKVSVWACQWISGDTCIVVLPRVDNRYVNQAGFHGLWRHEMGHCNGWPDNHPGARYPKA